MTRVRSTDGGVNPPSSAKTKLAPVSPVTLNAQAFPMIPAQAPPEDFRLPFAVSITDVPGSYPAEHFDGQSIAPSVLLTLPFPWTLTVSVTFSTGGGGGAGGGPGSTTIVVEEGGVGPGGRAIVASVGSMMMLVQHGGGGGAMIVVKRLLEVMMSVVRTPDPIQRLLRLRVREVRDEDEAERDEKERADQAAPDPARLEPLLRTLIREPKPQMSPSRTASATAWERVRALSFVTTSWMTFLIVRSL